MGHNYSKKSFDVYLKFKCVWVLSFYLLYLAFLARQADPDSFIHRQSPVYLDGRHFYGMGIN